MPTLQNTTHVPPKPGTRRDAIVILLGVLIAFGVAVAILGSTRANGPTTNATVVPHTVETAAPPPASAPNNYYTSHAVYDPITGQMHGAGGPARSKPR